MGGRLLEVVEFEKDVAVLLHKSFRPSMHCAKPAKKANSVLGHMCRGISYRDKDTYMGLFRILSDLTWTTALRHGHLGQ